MWDKDNAMQWYLAFFMAFCMYLGLAVIIGAPVALIWWRLA